MLIRSQLLTTAALLVEKGYSRLCFSTAYGFRWRVSRVECVARGVVARRPWVTGLVDAGRLKRANRESCVGARMVLANHRTKQTMTLDGSSPQPFFRYSCLSSVPVPSPHHVSRIIGRDYRWSRTLWICVIHGTDWDGILRCRCFLHQAQGVASSRCARRPGRCGLSCGRLWRMLRNESRGVTWSKDT